MGRIKKYYNCVTKRKRHNYDAVRKALQTRWAKRDQQENKSEELILHEESDTSLIIEPETATNSKRIGDIISTIVGNRIINFQYFWSQIMTIAEHGEKLNCKLNYLRVNKEKQIGLISTFELACALCGSKFILNTSEIQEQQPSIDLNAGTVSGTIMIGIGLSNLNELIASMDLPTFPFRLYSRIHDSVSSMWKAAAEQTMLNAANQEIEEAKIRGDVNNSGVPMIAVEADACWSKRSYKNNYSALSGVAAIIGEYSGKVLQVGVRNKFCSICTRASKKGETPRTHNCTKNHSGSSTSMEPAILVDCFKKSIKERNLIYKTLIADGDSSTYKSILESRPYADVPIQKIECTNHLLRNYNGKNLLLLKDTTIPLAERKLLTSNRLTRLRTAIRSAIKFRNEQNDSVENKIENLLKDIVNSPRHIFCDHTQCENYYCTEERKSEQSLIPRTQTLFLKLQKNATQLAINSRSLLHCYTNNRAEQFNNVVAKMVGGKRVNFSIKDSYTTRCYAAVVAFNTGKPQYTLYKSTINKSPGKSLKLLEARRNAKNCNEVKSRVKLSRKKLNYIQVNRHYGVACEQPDMDTEEFERGKKAFLDNLKEQVDRRFEIERSTVLQAESSLWLELRRCLLTASTFSKICKRKQNQNSAPLVKALLYGYDLSNIASVKHGKENEKRALLQLSVQENIFIENCGLFIDKDYCFLGATPDGIFSDGIVEIKCPSSAFGIHPETAIEQKKIKCFKLNNESNYILNPCNDWYYQVQGQLHIANKDVCVFAVWTGSNFPLKVVRVNRDDKFWGEKMLPKLTRFYYNCILPELIDPRKSRSMPIREIIL